MLKKTEAIILRSRHFRNTSLIFTFYTRGEGKIDGLAKGIKEDISRGEWGMEILSRVELIYYEKEPKTLRLLSHWYVLDSFKPLRTNLLKLAWASYLIELVDNLVHGEEKNENIYHLLLNSLRFMENGQDINGLIHFFELKLIKFLGYGLSFKTCSICRKKDPGPNPRFNPATGGIMCPECSKGKEDGITILKLSLLQFLEKADFETLPRLKISREDEKNLTSILHAYLRTLAGTKPLRTLKAIEKLNTAFI